MDFFNSIGNVLNNTVNQGVHLVEHVYDSGVHVGDSILRTVDHTISTAGGTITNMTKIAGDTINHVADDVPKTAQNLQWPLVVGGIVFLFILLERR